MATKKYGSLYAGSNTVTPDGKRITFYGPRFGHGVYETDDPELQKYLDSCVANSGNGIFAVEEDGTEKVKADPAVAEAIKDAAANTIVAATTPEAGLSPALAAARAAVAARSGSAGVTTGSDAAAGSSLNPAVVNPQAVS